MTAERARPTLRAIRREPLLVDDRTIADRLEAGGRLTADDVRWARAWMVCWFAALAADERFGRVDPWDLTVRLDAVVLPKGAGDGQRRRAVLDALVASGLASLNGSRDARLTEAAFVEHQAAIAIDWPTVVSRCAGEPAALLVMRALAELIVPLDGAAAVPRRDLVARTGYQQKQVRLALRRLVAADLLVATGDVGTTARYGLTARALGRAWPEPAEIDRPVLRAPAPESPTPPTPASPPEGTVANGVRLLIGGAMINVSAGATFEIGAGVSARLEIGRDGAPRLIVDGPTG